MKEFIEFTETKEIDPDSMAPPIAVLNEEWDGWGDTEDKKRFYELKSLDTSNANTATKPSSTNIVESPNISIEHNSDGWG